MDALEVDEHVPDARRAHGERGSQQNGIIGSADQLGETPRDVDVSGRQHAGVVELEQQPGRAAREAGVEALDEVGHALSPRSRTSLSASTSAGDGCQVNTPHGVPSTTGVSGPVIPRTNRYRTPARLRSAE